MSRQDELVVRISGDTTKLQEAAKKGKAELQAFKQASKEAAKVIESIQTPTEKYAAEQRKLNGLLKDGKITQEQHTKALAKSKEEMDKAKKSGDGLNKTFGTSSAGFKAGLVAIAIAAKAASDQFNKLRENARGALDAMKGNQATNKRLAQIADSPEDLQKMKDLADGIAAREGISREDARNLVFSGRSEGFAGEGFGDVARASALVGSQGAAQVAGGFRTLFRGRQDLSSQQAISGVLTAARSSKLDFDEIAQAASPAAESAGAAGTSAEELLGSLSVLSSRFKSGLTAGDRLKAFQAKVGNSDLAGQGILGAFESIKGMDEAGRKDFLGGSAEVKAVYDALLMDADKIREATALVAADFEQAARGGGTLTRQISAQETDKSFVATRAMNRAEVEKQIANENAAYEVAALEISQARQDTAEREEIDRGNIVGGRGGGVVGGLMRSAVRSTGLDRLTGGEKLRAVEGAREIEMNARIAQQQADLAEMHNQRLIEAIKENGQPQVVDGL